MEHDRSEGDSNSHSVHVNDMDLDDIGNHRTDASDTNMPEATVAFLVSPAVQEHYQPAGHNLPRQSIGNIRFDLDPSWKPFVGYSLVAWAELTTHWDTVIEEQVKKAEERATDITIHLNAAIDVINQMQQNIDKVSVRLSRMNIGDDNPSPSGPEAAKHKSEDEVEPGHSTAAAALPSQTADQLLSAYSTVKDDISAIMAEEGDRYKKEIKSFSPRWRC